MMTPKNVNRFLRETMKRATQPGRNTLMTDQSTPTSQSHACVHSDSNSKRQLTLADVRMRMTMMENAGREKGEESSAVTHGENRNIRVSNLCGHFCGVGV
jgi:hypothetical protein